MAGSYHDDVIDAALEVIVNNANALHVCSGTPTDRATVLSSSLATAAVDSDDFTGPAAGDVDGRKITVSAKPGVSVTASGAPAHYALIDGSRLLALTEVDPSSPDLTQGSTTDIPAVRFEIGDPVPGT